MLGGRCQSFGFQSFGVKMTSTAFSCSVKSDHSTQMSEIFSRARNSAMDSVSVLRNCLNSVSSTSGGLSQKSGATVE